MTFNKERFIEGAKNVVRGIASLGLVASPLVLLAAYLDPDVARYLDCSTGLQKYYHEEDLQKTLGVDITPVTEKTFLVTPRPSMEWLAGCKREKTGSLLEVVVRRSERNWGFKVTGTESVVDPRTEAIVAMLIRR